MKGIDRPNGPIASLVARWRTESDAYATDEAMVRGDRLLRRVAEELESALACWTDEPLGLQVAAEVSGYSVAHLRRLVAQGSLTDAATVGPIMLRRGDLPRKPGHAQRWSYPILRT